MSAVAAPTVSGNVLVGYGAPASAPGRRRRAAVVHPLPARPTTGAERPRVASQAVRALARARGVELTAVLGTGPDGVITRDDVERACGALGAEL